MLFITIQDDGFLGTALDKSLLIRDAPYEKACPVRRPPELLKPTLIRTVHSSLLKNNDRLSLTLNKAK